MRVPRKVGRAKGAREPWSQNSPPTMSLLSRTRLLMGRMTSGILGAQEVENLIFISLVVEDL